MAPRLLFGSPITSSSWTWETRCETFDILTTIASASIHLKTRNEAIRLDHKEINKFEPGILSWPSASHSITHCIVDPTAASDLKYPRLKIPQTSKITAATNSIAPMLFATTMSYEGNFFCMCWVKARSYSSSQIYSNICSIFQFNSSQIQGIYVDSL